MQVSNSKQYPISVIGAVIIGALLVGAFGLTLMLVERSHDGRGVGATVPDQVAVIQPDADQPSVASSGAVGATLQTHDMEFLEQNLYLQTDGRVHAAASTGTIGTERMKFLEQNMYLQTDGRSGGTGMGWGIGPYR